MICKNCGAQIPDGSSFCTECGAPVQQEPVQQEPVQQQYEQPQYTPVMNSAPVNTTPILIFGILALALSLCIPYVGWIGGLICAIICSKKVKEYTAAGGVIAGKVKVGKILGTVGLIASIVMAVVWFIAIIVSIIAAIAGSSSSSFNYYY